MTQEGKPGERLVELRGDRVQKEARCRRAGTLGASEEAHAEALDELSLVNERHRRHRRHLREGALLLRVRRPCLRSDGPDTLSLRGVPRTEVHPTALATP